MRTQTDKIIRRIRAKRRGWVFTPKDFLDMSSRATVDQVLSRLVKQGTIRRLDRGLYDYPKQHPVLGLLSLNTDSLAQAMARQSGDFVFPSGATAANLLGLSTQVPVKPTFMTDGPSRIKKVAGRSLQFKHTNVPIMPHMPDRINYLLQALVYLRQDNIDDDVIDACAGHLGGADLKLLDKAAPRLPGWLADVTKKIQSRYHGKLRPAA